jgi:hypothetical protein
MPKAFLDGEGYSSPFQQLRQFRDIRRDPPGLIFGEQLCRRSPARLVLEIDIGELSGRQFRCTEDSPILIIVVVNDH